MANRTRTRRGPWLAVVALLLAQAATLSLVSTGEAATKARTRTSSHKSAKSTNREVAAARALLAAQDALPRIEGHLAAARYEEAAVLLDDTRGSVTSALDRTRDARLRRDLEAVRKKADKLGDRITTKRREVLLALPAGATLVGPPVPPAEAPEPPAVAAATGTGGASTALAVEVAPAEDIPLPGEENDPSYALPALDDGSIPLESHPLVDKWLDYFTGRGRPTFERWLERSGRYMGSMKAILEKEGVPTDLVHLVFVESGFNPHARSVSHAVGPWQFIRGTANLFGLKVNSWVDERKDPDASTVAAARYLKHLYGLFNSWPLALASYNAGEGAVGRAIERQGTRDFWSLRLPEETRNYVPKFMAVLAISRDPSRYGFDQVAVAEPLAYDEVTIPGPVDLRALAEACGTDLEQIRDLNPQFLRGAAPAQGDQVTLRVPDGAGESLLANLADGTLELPKVATPADPLVLRHKVRRGESLKSISLRYGVPASTIARANRIGKSSRLRVGRTLRVPMGDAGGRGATTLAGSSSAGGDGGAPAVRTVKVRRGQTLSEIAATHGVTVTELRRANGLDAGATLRAGQRIKIPTAS